MTKDHPSLKKLPDAPGVYFFLGPKREVLYVGKATSLRDRVRSYFSHDLAYTRGQRIVQMRDKARRVDFKATDSVLEALILEAKLIKELKPVYNADGKDDKSYNHLIITIHEPYPRLLTVRGKDLAATLEALERTQRAAAAEPVEKNTVTRSSSKGRTHRTYRTPPVYGPFVHAGQYKEALKIIRRIFPYYDTKRPVLDLMQANDKKVRFNQAIGVYPDLAQTPALYARTIRHIRLFLEGKKKELMRQIERDMHAYARKQLFEQAATARRQLLALRHLEDVALLRREEREPDRDPIRIEAYDIAHQSGSAMIGVMTVVENGELLKSEYRSFTIQSVMKSNDTAALKEVLARRLAHPEWQYPRLIVVDGGKAQLNTAKRVLDDAGVVIPVVAVTKDDRHRPRALTGNATLRRQYAEDILLANSEAHRFSLALHRRKMRKRAR